MRASSLFSFCGARLRRSALSRSLALDVDSEARHHLLEPLWIARRQLDVVIREKLQHICSKISQPFHLLRSHAAGLGQIILVILPGDAGFLQALGKSRPRHSADRYLLVLHINFRVSCSAGRAPFPS